MTDTHSPYSLMQRAVDIVGSSPHPTNKVAALLHGEDLLGTSFTVSSTNYWVKPIIEKIGTDHDIGSASGTIHAEMGCILKAPRTKFSAVFITDPPCPNCTKYMAEAGVKEIYIDHKGFYKDFAQRRGTSFAHMSLRICQKAGIEVFEVWRKEKRIDVILDHQKTYKPPIENPAHTEPLDKNFSSICIGEHTPESLRGYAAHYQIMNTQRYGTDEHFAFCLTRDIYGSYFVLSANIHPVIGYTSDMHEMPENKYSFLLQPVNRLLTNAARKGLEIIPHSVFYTRVPTSRELVNMLGSGLDTILIGNPDDCRDEWGIKALEQLENAGIFTHLSV